MEITGTAQREAWLRRVMPPAEQLDGDLWSVPVPIPDNPLRYVSSYAFGTGEGLVLIDAGWGSEEAWQSLLAGLESIGAGIADVRGVLVTHLHFDHIGLAGRIRQACGAWIALHPADHAVLSLPDYRRAELAVAREADFLRDLCASPAEAAAAVGTPADWEKFAAMALLEDGELADVPGWKLRALHTPGHTPGHRPGRRHHRPPRAAARRAAGRGPPSPGLHAVGAGRAADLVPSLGRVRRPDADLRGHRDRRAPGPPRAPRPGDRDRHPPAWVPVGPRAARAGVAGGRGR